MNKYDKIYNELRHEPWKIFWSYELPKMNAQLEGKRYTPMFKTLHEKEVYEECLRSFHKKYKVKGEEIDLYPPLAKEPRFELK